MRFVLLIIFLHSFGATNAQDSLYAFVRSDNHWGVINEKGKIVIDEQYLLVNSNGIEYLPIYDASKSMIYYPKDGLFKFKEKKKWGFINLKQEVVISKHFVEPYSFQDGYAVAFPFGKSGIINKTGDFLFDPISEKIIGLSEGKILFKKGRSFGFLNIVGTVFKKNDY